MDLILEVADYYGFDKFYATLFPIAPDSVIGSTAAAAASAVTHNSSPTEQIVSTFRTQAPKFLKFAANWHGNKLDRYGVAPTHWFAPTEYAAESILLRDNILRQSLTLFLITTFFGWVLYLGTAWISYIFVYDHDNFNHPKFLKNQMRLEIIRGVTAIPTMTALTVPWFVAEAQGYSKLYYSLEDNGGYFYLFMQFPIFLLFTDFVIYWAHRWLHHPWVYKNLHKPHHKWIVSTPFASHAFHPVDGYVQSIAYHIFPFVFPLQKICYLGLFMFVNIWSVLIHDGEYLAHDPIINGSACHTIHHLYFNYNYGQYTTFWDRLFGTHRQPDKELFNPWEKKAGKTIKKQVVEMEHILAEVEGEDDRVYASAVTETVSVTKRR
ncbi:C-5 sterol desaturase [Starmerella bacillaris]|uniref:C-5 sterol desaturase n=1 Tax=Starmerella bacillaris TaxID=1247836 RepID=A0AAV5REV5_STABA|nr:C-5 sterol desaturase [Starmerella bacillaris]